MELKARFRRKLHTKVPLRNNFIKIWESNAIRNVECLTMVMINGQVTRGRSC